MLLITRLFGARLRVNKAEVNPSRSRHPTTPGWLRSGPVPRLFWWGITLTRQTRQRQKFPGEWFDALLVTFFASPPDGLCQPIHPSEHAGRSRKSMQLKLRFEAGNHDDSPLLPLTYLHSSTYLPPSVSLLRRPLQPQFLHISAFTHLSDARLSFPFTKRKETCVVIVDRVFYILPSTTTTPSSSFFLTSCARQATRAKLARRSPAEGCFVMCWSRV